MRFPLSLKFNLMDGEKMNENKVIGFTEFFGKVNAIVVKNGKVELQETDIKNSECSWID